MQGLVRTVLRELMGIQVNSEMLPTPMTDGSFWTDADPNSTNRFLRPSWELWQLNAQGWEHEVACKILEQGRRFYDVPRKINADEFFGSLTLPEVKAAIKTYWHSLHARWVALQKDATQRNKEGSAGRQRTRRFKVLASTS